MKRLPPRSARERLRYRLDQRPKPPLEVALRDLPIMIAQIQKMFAFLGTNVAKYLAEQWERWTVVKPALTWKLHRSGQVFSCWEIGLRAKVKKHAEIKNHP